MESRKIRVAITHGDTNGVGYELIFKTFAEPEMLELCTPIIYGSPKVASYHRKALEMQANFSIISNAEEAKDGRVNMLTTVDGDVKVDMGMPTDESSDAALRALDRAMTDYRAGLYDVLITAPVNDGGINVDGYSFRGHKAYIETSVGDGQKGMDIYVNNHMRLAFVADGVAMKDVARTITADHLAACATLLFHTLKRDFNISNPRIAVLSLNAPTTKGFGSEEQTIITPTVEQLTQQGIQVFGPYAADKLLGEGDYEQFDAVLAMYHDQAMPTFHGLSTEYEMVYTAGLPIIRTASTDGVGYEEAGRGIVSEDSFRNALYLAIDAYRQRNRHDESLQNPLRKLYHERRDESEKVRFSVPKKRPASSFVPRKDSEGAKQQRGEGRNDNRGEVRNERPARQQERRQQENVPQQPATQPAAEAPKQQQAAPAEQAKPAAEQAKPATETSKQERKAAAPALQQLMKAMQQSAANSEKSE